MAEKEDMKQEPELEEKASDVEEKKKKQSKKEERKESELKKQVAELTDKLAKEKDDYIRLMAEFETFRRRSAEDRLSLTASAAADTVKGMLPVLDACERAMEMLASSADEAAIEGTNLIYNKLMDYLKTKGLDKIETVLQHTQGANPAGFDYRFNLGYGQRFTAADPRLAALRAPIDAETERLARESEGGG